MGKVRLCCREDIPRVADIFRGAFPESVENLVPGVTPSREVFIDIFAFLLRALARDFFVAEADGNVQGYIVAPAVSMNRVWIRAVCSGTLLRWAGKWMLGKYRVPVRAIPAIICNKLMFVSTEKNHSPPGRYGRILSIAVAAEARGLGLGKLLVRHGIEHLKDRGVDFVKLEVRPANIPALRAYLRNGFVEMGRTRDVQGDWLVMIRDLRY